MRRRQLHLVILLQSAGLFGSTVHADSSGPSAESHRFPDFNLAFRPTQQEYNGPLFRLSQNYPSSPLVDPPDQDIARILSIPFDQNGDTQNWMRYLQEVKTYCLDGNIEVEWRGQDNFKRKWYHVPWQHAGDKGREGIHGLTREATAKPRQLASTQKDSFDTYAVALYNHPGGYTIGDVWKDQFEPNAKAAHFPEGTVVVKVLFTMADKDQIPYLVNPIEWKAYVRDPSDKTRRVVRHLRLIQMDVMIRDRRADKTGGWVFGTYCYQGNLANQNPWDNLVPVGIQWGNDPDYIDPDKNPENPEPTKTLINTALRETIINDSDDLPAQHLGWGGRLNGPVDYYRSSCVSCHSTAQYPSIVEQHPDFLNPIKYTPEDPQWGQWFRNLDYRQAFSPISKYDKSRAISTDFSLQLSMGIEHFYNWKAQLMGGHFTPVLPGAPQPIERVDTVSPRSEPPSSANP